MVHCGRRRLRPRHPGRLQVLRLLRHGRLRRARLDRPGHAAAAGDDRAPRRRQLLQLPGGHLRRRREAAADRARLAARRCDLPELLPPPRRRADRPGQRVPSSAQEAEGSRPGGGRRGADADRPRADQEGDDRRLPRPRGRGQGLRGAAGLQRAGRDPRRLRLRGPDLLRLLRLHGHGDRARAADGLRLPPELQQPLPRHRLPRLLAPLAHDPLALPARLPLHPPRRQPQGTGPDLHQPDADHGPRRPLARGGLELRRLGRVPGDRPLGRARDQGATRPDLPRLAALVRHLQPDRRRVDPLPLDRPEPLRRLHVRAGPLRAGNPLLGAGGRGDRAR